MAREVAASSRQAPADERRPPPPRVQSPRVSPTARTDKSARTDGLRSPRREAAAVRRACVPDACRGGNHPRHARGSVLRRRSERHTEHPRGHAVAFIGADDSGSPVAVPRPTAPRAPSAARSRPRQSTVAQIEHAGAVDGSQRRGATAAPAGVLPADRLWYLLPARRQLHAWGAEPGRHPGDDSPDDLRERMD